MNLRRDTQVDQRDPLPASDLDKIHRLNDG
jgi:hypothetical protein